MLRSRVRSVVLVSLLIGSAAALSGCSRSATSPAEQSSAAGKAAPLSIGEFQLGKRLGSHGGIAPGAETTRFALGDTIHIAMRLRDAPRGTLVKVVWKAPGGQALGDETSDVKPGQEYVHFSADSENLQVGAGYHAEISANGKPVTVVSFDLT